MKPFFTQLAHPNKQFDHKTSNVAQFFPEKNVSNKDARETVVFGCMCGRFGALMGPPMVGKGRYANPR